MIKQNNTKSYLRLLLKYNYITFNEYIFRLTANKLNIKTYK
jgi:hypothetical protein